MMELWPVWLRPWWLLLLPLLCWLSWQLWRRPHRSGRWQALLPKHFHAALLIGGEGQSSRLPWIILTLAWLLTLLALLGPSWQLVEQNALKRADPLVVVLDLSQSMLAADLPPSRLEQAQRKLLDLLQARGEAQTAIVVYAGSAHSLVPLSDDLLTARNLIEALKPAIMPVPGQRADLAIGKALQLLQQGAQGQGRILLMTDQLSSLEQNGIRQLLSSSDHPLDILGIGTLQGAPIPQANGSFVKDAYGNILLPRLDDRGLRKFASELGGRYSQVRLNNSDLERLKLLDAANQSLRQSEEATQLQLWQDAGHWLLLPLLLLAACAGRRGWLFVLPLLLVLPQPSYAFEFADLWLRPDQQGQRLLQQEQPAAAAERFENSQWQGMALYQAGDYNAAAQRFSLGDSASDHYNRGNALAQDGELEAALDAYETALERQPTLTQAQANQALVKQLLEQKQKQQEQQQDQQQQNNDAQNQQNQKDQQGQQQGQQSEQPAAGEQGGQPGTDPAAQPTPDQEHAEQTPGSEQSTPAQPKEGQSGQPSAAEKNAEPGAANSSAANRIDAEPLEANPAANDQQTPAKPATADDQNSQDGQQVSPDGEPTEANDNQDSDASPSEQQPPLDDEGRQALEQWLRQIPDDPAELLRRKFWYEQQQHQEAP